MIRSLKRTLLAALILSAVPAASFAQSPGNERYPAIANGLAIPIDNVPVRIQSQAHGRYVLVDTASARLFMIEDGEVRDSMRVIVGKPMAATPTLNGTLYYATLNPYWNVPTDLARTIVAPKVLKEGPAYLRRHGYEVVSAFTANARVLPPESVDWQAVAAGSAEVHVRQLPGPGNSMGQVKFGFDNDSGIFLHDTPRKELFAEDQRQLSNGCVRLEDAPRFAHWLLGRDPDPTSAPEQHVPLPRPVPIIITHIGPADLLHVAAAR